ncbi:MAG: DUF5615 family PIN-like protein [Candidatus Vogelbacteria bacterium]|nr:DUF5615 family PIN-like protein [Candidatus Vogelbacteria bacterium]
MPSDKMAAVIDEDLSRSIGVLLGELGWEVKDVRDVGLRGKSDKLIINFAKKRGAVLFSGDWGFANILEFPPRNYHGIVIISFPNEVPTAIIVSEMKRLIGKLKPSDFRGNLIIIEPGRVRIRKGT